MKRYVYKIASKRYVPRWMYYVRSFCYIVDAVADLVLIPFGRQLGLTGSWSERILRRGFERRKLED